MALVFAIVKKDSTSLCSFSFRSHVQLLSETLPISHLKYPYHCFSSNFCFQVFDSILFVLCCVYVYKPF